MRNLCVVLALLTSVPVATVSAEVPLKGHEAAGQAAEAAGRFEEAFREYLQAFRALPEPPPVAADVRLREAMIRVVPRLGTPPTVSQEAEQHYMKAQSLVEAQEALGTASDTGALQAAAATFRKAVRAAPWWSDALIALAKLQQQLKRYDEAADNLRLYRLAQSAAAPPADVAPAAERPSDVPKATETASPTIHVYWAPQFGTGSLAVECNGRLVAKLKRRRLLALKAVPGTHTIKFWNRSIAVTLDHGQERYVRVQAGSFGAKLRLVSKEEATAEMREERMTPNDPKATFNDECQGSSK